MRLVKSIAAALLMVCAPLTASAEGPLSLEEKAEIEQVVRDYLLKNPEIIAQAIGELQRREEVAALERQRAAMKAMAKDLGSSPLDPVIGNPDGDVTVVEFFDYRCGYCKRVFEDALALIKEDGNVRYVLKEYPVLGEQSIYAARASMAVWLHQRDKYFDFHSAMLSSRGALSNAKVMELAQQSGVNTGALAVQMQDGDIDKALTTTRAQADALLITGTPSFVIGEALVPGAIPLPMMRKLVAVAREATVN